jgi:sterol desaturase/sphingolipid hydroxylase (fatty acid hydroxylase superfamily)
MEAVLANEVPVRIACFTGLLVLLAILEALFPRRTQTIARPRRWPANLGIALVNTIVVRGLFPITAVGAALSIEARGWGLINLVAIPDWLGVVVGFLVLDLTIYGQHVVFHKVPLLWRLHRMHHADLEFDVTTGLRFHPIEVLLSLLIKLAVIALAGVPALAVLAFEVALNATSMFNHANLALPLAFDRALRLFVVTPDMHRVHHSILPYETDSNFGFNMPWWDRLFGTYRAQPTEGHAGMTIGIAQFRDPAELRLDRMLVQPLRSAESTQ